MARREFDIPVMYSSPIIRKVKDANKILDPRKKDVTPSLLDFGPVQFLIPRHFGFCYGVENAIDIAYRTVEENPDRNIYLLSEMINNRTGKKDRTAKGGKFLLNTTGTKEIRTKTWPKNDTLIEPPLGTTIRTRTNP